MTERQQQPHAAQLDPSREHADLMRHLSEIQEIVDRHIIDGGKPLMAMEADEAVALMTRVEPYLQFHVSYENILNAGRRMLFTGAGAVMKEDDTGLVPVAMCEHHHTAGTFVGLRLAGVPSVQNFTRFYKGEQGRFSDDASLSAVLQLEKVTSHHVSSEAGPGPSGPLVFERLEIPLIYGMVARYIDLEESD